MTTQTLPVATEFYFMSRGGHLQYLPLEDGGGAFPVADNHDDALRLARWMRTWRGERTKRRQIMPALVGEIPGETIEGLIGLAIEDGCRFVVKPTGWNADGSPEGWAYIGLDDSN